MTAIERDNPALKEVLSKDYARPALDKQRLGQLIDMMGNIRVGDAEARSRDVLGRVYDPCCGSSGMFVQSVEFIRAHASGNANFAWVQHMVHYLAPRGLAGFVLANGSMSSNQSGEGEIGQRAEASRLDAAIEENLRSLGFGVEVAKDRGDAR